ncbi:hypothetical protein [Dysosmobacter sp.]|uniref:hypothetical protein n=1 Tax=Dysosmobacter sp. TaxID=2591382 RepID=UPI003FD8892F
MAFFLQSMDVGQTPPIEYRQAKAEEAVVLGEALVTDSTGLLTKCGATVRPDYIAVGPQDDNDIVPVVKVQDYQIWHTQLSAAGTSLKPGNKVTLEADGLRVTATTTSGVATIVDLEGTGVGDGVRVRF